MFNLSRWFGQATVGSTTDKGELPDSCQPIRYHTIDLSLTGWPAIEQRLVRFCQELPDPDGDDLLSTRLIGSIQRADVESTSLTATAQAIYTLALALENTVQRLSVTLLDASGQGLQRWTPLAGPMTRITNARYYQANSDTNPQHIEGLWRFFLPHLVPTPLLQQLLCKNAFAATAVDSPNREAAKQQPPPIVVSASRAGRKSTNLVRREYLLAIKQALRELLSDPAAVNQPNGQGLGWRIDDSLWVIGKHLAQQLRQHPALIGYENRLQQNSTLYRFLVAHQLAKSAGAKPIWTVYTTGNRQGPKEAALCILLPRLWDNPDDWPTPYTGAVLVEDADSTLDSKTTSGAKKPIYTNLFNEND